MWKDPMLEEVRFSREKLLENWNLAERKEDLRKVRPLV
jgi:hypothetical protein